MIIRKYCLAVRSALTYDGHPPFSAPGPKLHKRLSLIIASLERVAEIGELPSSLDKLYRLLTKGVAATEQLWPDIQAGYDWVHRAAHVLTNADHHSSKEVQQQYKELLEKMRQSTSLTASLQQMTATFLKVTTSYWSGLFYSYDVTDLPRTNNDLEHVFGSTRYHERRETSLSRSCRTRLGAQLPPRTTTSVGPNLAPRDLT